MKVDVFAAQVHVDLVVAHIEQNLTMCNAKLEWGGDGAAQRSGKEEEEKMVLVSPQVSFKTMYICSCIGCICLTFLHCAFPNVYSKSLDQRRQSHTGCIFLAIRHRVFSKASSNRLPERRLIHIGCIYLASSTVCFQMSVQSV